MCSMLYIIQQNPHRRKTEGLILSKWDNKSYGKFKKKVNDLWHMDLNISQTVMKMSAFSNWDEFSLESGCCQRDSCTFVIMPAWFQIHFFT